ncbi:hypothetical protein AVEN_199678-1 [Araneus ventricosus]|uniref:Uncharacterized protein n=1 Tax=Araneus ventricosus TaxID=182803 RepID=A0A4Y2DGT4_ARAVE|nr:hypothetical protein AVEN_199678-1 [Araneus ventricosus]
MADVGKRKAFSISAEKHGVNAFSQNEIECCDDDVITSEEVSEGDIVALVNEKNNSIVDSSSDGGRTRRTRAFNCSCKRFEQFFCHRKQRRTCCGPVEKSG